MLVLNEWNEKFKERDQLDHYKSKESYDLLMNHLSEYPRLIAKNEECDYRKAVSELRFRYGEPQNAVNEAIEGIEFHLRNSIINPPNPHPDSGDFSRGEAIDYVRFELNYLKQMAARGEIYQKLIQDEPRTIDRIVSAMPEEMEASFVENILGALNIFDMQYNEKYFKKLIEFLIDELPKMSMEQHSKVIGCKINASSRTLEEDVDLQPNSEADSDNDPEVVSSDGCVNENLKDIENENAEFLTGEIPNMDTEQ